jgi:branched-chain amino acid transport system permease protein
MSLFVQLTINGLIAGSIYALVASGFSLIYGTNRFMHFAHGVSVVIASYILFFLFTILRINFFAALVLTLVASTLFGFGMFRLIYLPLQKRKASNIILLIASLAMLIIFQNVIQLFFGPNVRSIDLISNDSNLGFLGASITSLQLIIVVTSLILCLLLYLLMKKTRLGRNLRAVADNKELARIVGIDEQKVAGYSFMIGSFIAGIAGVLIGLEQFITPLMGTNLIIKGFTGAVVGGIMSVPASILGSYIVGLAENYGVWFVPTAYKDAIGFVLLFIFLLWKPTGLFGTNNGGKK